MTAPLPRQAAAQIAPQPERANALLMNNKSTLITNCQANQLALQLPPTQKQLSVSAQLHLTPRRALSSRVAVTRGGGITLRPETGAVGWGGGGGKLKHRRVLSV